MVEKLLLGMYSVILLFVFEKMKRAEMYNVNGYVLLL